MMVRVAQPEERGEQHAALQRLLDAAQHLAEEQAVGEHRHVQTVLFERGDGKEDGHVARQGGDVGPFQFREFHGCDLLATATWSIKGEAGANGNENQEMRSGLR